MEISIDVPMEIYIINASGQDNNNTRDAKMKTELKNEIKILTAEWKKMDARKPEYRDMAERILGLQAKLNGANW
jgi:hypothetical protein